MASPFQVVGAHSSEEADRAFSHVADAELGPALLALRPSHAMEYFLMESPPIEVTGSFITPVHPEHPAEEVDTRRSKPRRFLTMNQFGKVIGFLVVVVTQMSGSSEKQRNISLGFLAAILAVCAMEFWEMTREVIIFQIASNSTKLLALYLLLSILKPGWLSWYGILIVCITATAVTFSDEVKTKFTWCCEKVGLVIKYVSDKVSKSLKDQASPASPPPRASV